MVRPAGAVLGVLLVVGCGDGEPRAGGGEADGAPVAAVSDSAGIRVVTYPADAVRPSPWRLEEQLRIGGTDGPGEVLFSVIAGGRLRRNGEVVLADRQASEVRRFASDGTLIDIHGREGEGPGEYEYIRALGACAREGFTVFDLHWGMSVYDAEGRFVEERPVRLEGEGSPYNLACARDGRMAVANWDRSSFGAGGAGPPQGFHTATTRLRVLDSAGAEILDLGERIGSERWGDPRGSRPHPAGRSTLFGFQGGDLIVTDGSFFGYERWSPDGELLEIVRIDVPPPDVDSLAAAYVEATLAAARDEETRRRWRQQVEAMTWPERSTYFSDLVVTERRIAAREVSLPDARGRWFVFGAEGEPLGWLPLPPGARLLDFRGDRVLVEERDELDVPRAVVYRLQPVTAPSDPAGASARGA